MLQIIFTQAYLPCFDTASDNFYINKNDHSNRALDGTAKLATGNQTGRKLAALWSCFYYSEVRGSKLEPGENMCGRFLLVEDGYSLKVHFNATGDIHYSPRYNIAPSQNVPVIRLGKAGREISLMHWGLIPHWSKESKLKYSTINARAETLEQKPVYRTPFKRTRCLVPASGFYEWKKVAGGKQPYLIKSKSGLMAFAGLWDHWEKHNEAIDSFTIIVTDANKKVMAIHDRMPVILHPNHYDQWLDPNTPADLLKSVLVPWNEDDTELRPVSTYVNSPRNDDPKCMESV